METAQTRPSSRAARGQAPTFGAWTRSQNDAFCKAIAPSVRDANKARANYLNTTVECTETYLDRYGDVRSYQKTDDLRMWEVVQLSYLTLEKQQTREIYSYQRWSKAIAQNFSLYPPEEIFPKLQELGLFSWDRNTGPSPTDLTTHLIQTFGIGSSPSATEMESALNTRTLKEGVEAIVQERTEEITRLFSHLPGGITGIDLLKDMTQKSTWGRRPYFEITQLKLPRQLNGQIDALVLETYQSLAKLGYLKVHKEKYCLTRKGKALAKAKDPVKELNLKPHDLVIILQQDIAHIAVEKRHRHQSINDLETKIKLETDVLEAKQAQRASVQVAYDSTKSSLETFEQENPIPRNAKGLMDWEERHMEKSMAFSELSLKLARLDKETELHQATQNQLQRSLNASIEFFRNWNRATYQKLAQLKESIYQLEDTSHSLDLLAQFKQYCMIESVFQGEVADLNAQFRKMVVQSEFDYQKAVVTMGQSHTPGQLQDLQLQQEVDRALLQADMKSSAPKS